MDARGDYDGLKKYIDRWSPTTPTVTACPVWDSADASGMDNQVMPRRHLHRSRTKAWTWRAICYRELQAMAIIAGSSENTDDQRIFRPGPTRLGQKINASSGTTQDGFYYDRNEKTGQPIKVKTVIGFLPLWAGIAPRAGQPAREGTPDESARNSGSNIPSRPTRQPSRFL